jgi:predicted kinase
MGGVDRPLGNGDDGDRIPDEQLLEHAESVAPAPEPRESRTRQEHADTIPAPGRVNQEAQSPPERGDSSEADDSVPRPPYLTLEEHAERISDVLNRLIKAHAADLPSDHQHTTDRDRKQWTAERNRIQGEIVRDIYSSASEVPCEYKATIVGGLPGAGKTTILSQLSQIDQSKYLTINPDHIKEVMARRGLIPEVEGLSPMEASELVHEESSTIAKQLAHKAQLDGKNVIWDITMSRLDSTKERIADLRAAGYTQIDGIFVDISIDTSLRRTQARHREDDDKWLAGEGLGGRFIPPKVIQRQVDSEWGSKSRKHFEIIKTDIDNWVVLDNDVDGRPATLMETSAQPKASQHSREERTA